MIVTLDRGSVVAQIDDWEKRLRGLVATVREFAARHPNASELKVLEGSVVQHSELPMEQHEVQPRLLPTIAVLHGLKKVSFGPSVLWLIGANGSVSMKSNSHAYLVVDRNEVPGAAPNWRVVTSRLENTHRPFDYRVFEQMLETQKLD
jgi:hypothetical protein